MAERTWFFSALLTACLYLGMQFGLSAARQVPLIYEHASVRK